MKLYVSVKAGAIHKQPVIGIRPLCAVQQAGLQQRAARIGGVTLQIVRDWVLRFNASGPVGLINRKAPGAVRVLDDRPRLAQAPPGTGPAWHWPRLALAPPGTGAEGRAGADSGTSRCGALAGGRSLPVDVQDVDFHRIPDRRAERVNDFETVGF